MGRQGRIGDAIDRAGWAHSGKGVIPGPCNKAAACDGSNRPAGVWCSGSSPARSLALPPPDPIGDRIAAAFSAHDIRKTRGGYTLAEPRTGRPIARIKLLPGTNRFELFYWSIARERWKTFGPFGFMRLEFDDVADIVQSEPLFRIRHKGFLASLFG